MAPQHTRVYSFILYASMLVLSYILCLAIFVQSPQAMDIPAYMTLAAVSVLIFAFYRMTASRSPLFSMGRIPYLCLLSASVLLPRLLWVLTVDTEVYSDFSLYHTYAVNASKGIYNSYDLTYTLFPFKFGYPLVLSLLYRLFGANLLAAKLLNVFASLCLALLIYRVSSGVFGEAAARTSGMLFAFLPAQIMYCSVLGSEHLFTLLFFLSVSLFLRFQQAPGAPKSYAYLLGSGLSLALSHWIRPVAMLLFPAVFLYLLLVHPAKEEAPVVKKLFFRLRPALAVTAGFIAVFSLLGYAQAAVTGVSPLRASSGFNLLVGTNYESTGKYSAADERAVEIYKNDFDTFHRVSRDIALHRIKSSPGAFLRLLEKKCAVQWANEDFGYYWSTLKLSGATVPANFLQTRSREFYYISLLYYAALLFFSLPGCFYIRKDKAGTPVLFLLIFLGFFSAHLFLEVQSRYHYPVIPFFILLAGAGLSRFPRKEPLQDIF